MSDSRFKETNAKSAKEQKPANSHVDSHKYYPGSHILFKKALVDAIPGFEEKYKAAKLKNQ